jgi:hypothetical protein
MLAILGNPPLTESGKDGIWKIEIGKRKVRELTVGLYLKTHRQVTHLDSASLATPLTLPFTDRRVTNTYISKPYKYPHPFKHRAPYRA